LQHLLPECLLGPISPSHGSCENIRRLILLTAMSDSGPRFRHALTHTQRQLTVLSGFGIVVVFGIAGWLTPDSRGFGTHQQLGMPACSFQLITGIKCPHCGLTTSFSWFIRGQFEKSFRANPAGLVLAIASVGILIWTIVVNIRGAFVITNAPGRDAMFGFGIWVLLSIVIWVFRGLLKLM
jgi:hypothetical protein